MSVDSATSPLSPAPLPLRLRAIADHVIAGRPFADLGTDHGLLPVALVAGGTVPFAVASDVHPDALDRARERIAAHALEDRISARLGDGLSVLRPEDRVATLAIAGMGGGKARRVLTRTPPDALGIERLVLQINRDRELLLAVLGELGWSLLTTVEGPPSRWRWFVDVLERAR